MTDEERAQPPNAIWLCRPCAKKIDADESRYPPDLLLQWKTNHEAWVDAGCPAERQPLREVVAKDGVGSVVLNQGPGTGLEVTSAPGQPAERISVEGTGVGEVIVNSGTGTGKKVVSYDATASQSHVVVNEPVRSAIGLHATVAFVVCASCGTQFPVSKMVQAFAGEREPSKPVPCPKCGTVRLV